MQNLEDVLKNLIVSLRNNFKTISANKEFPLVQVRPPKSSGVYMLFFDGELQYIGFSANLFERLRGNLLSGDKKSHTLINKLCELREWDELITVDYLKSNSTVKFLQTKTEDDAKILEGVLIAIHHPFFNIPLRKLRKMKASS